jgi:hypothetical protein
LLCLQAGSPIYVSPIAPLAPVIATFISSFLLFFFTEEEIVNDVIISFMLDMIFVTLGPLAYALFSSPTSSPEINPLWLNAFYTGNRIFFMLIVIPLQAILPLVVKQIIQFPIKPPKAGFKPAPIITARPPLTYAVYRYPIHGFNRRIARTKEKWLDYFGV